MLPKTIFDTDIGWDCDDAGALALLYRLCDASEAKLWPGELVYSSTEIGTYIVTMKGWRAETRPGDPVALSYGIHNGGVGRSSWDHTAVLEAVRPNTYWNYRPWGRVSVDDQGITSHRIDGAGKQTFLLPKVDYTEVADVIDGIMGRME